jgi:hypothetical protein
MASVQATKALLEAAGASRRALAAPARAAVAFKRANPARAKAGVASARCAREDRGKKSWTPLSVLAREGAFAGMADAHDVDHPPGFLDSIENHIFADDEPAEVMVDPFGEGTSQPGLVGEIPKALAEIRDDTLGGGRVFLGDEVQELGHPFQSGIGPENSVGH